MKTISNSLDKYVMLRKIPLTDELVADELQDTKITVVKGIGVWPEQGAWHCLGKLHRKRKTALVCAKRFLVRMFKKQYSDIFSID